MRLLALFFAFISSSAMAGVDSTHQIFFGENTPSVESCGAHGRMLKPSEIENIGRSNLCRDVSSPWGLWKIMGDDGTFWTLTGSGYNCDMKPGSNPYNQSLCVMNDVSSSNTSYGFESHDYKGIYPWSGQARINGIGDEVSNSSIRSFKLGDGVQLIAYPESNFKGIAEVYTQSVNDTGFEVKSYKLKVLQTEENVTFDLLSHSPYRTCLKLKASLSVDDITSFCSEDMGGPSKVLTQIATQQMQDTVAVYIEEYLSPEVQGAYTGVIYLSFDGQGSFSIGHTALPQQLSVTQNGNNLSFVYK